MGKQTTVLEKQREFIPEAQFAVTTAPALPQRLSLIHI